MAVNSSEQEKSCLLGDNRGKSNIPITNSCFQMLKPSFDEVNQHYAVDVFPVFVEEASVPMTSNYPFNTAEQNIYSISLLPEEDDLDVQCAPNLAVLSLLEVQDPCKDQICSDAQLDCEDCIDLQIESMDAFSPCVVDIDIEKGSYQLPKSNDETSGVISSDGLLANMQRVLRRQVSLKTGEKLMQLLMDNSTMLLKLTSKEKSVAERAHEISNNRWRKYKRAASFDSRKVVILFSIVSSVGTLILIYLTLKVRQNADGLVHSW